MFMSRKVPVPWVHLTVPGSMQPWAKRAACWSAMAPRMGISAPRRSPSVTP